MSAIITIIMYETGKSIQMSVGPEEHIEKIIERCTAYWKLEGEIDDYILVKNDTELQKDKTVISSEIQEGDVIRFYKKENRDTEERADGLKEVESSENDEILAERWLKQNIGVVTGNIDLVQGKNTETAKQLLFKNLERNQHYSLVIENGSVKTYLPAILDVFDYEGGS